MDVAVVGGGIVGVAAAAFLAEGGAGVTMIEKVEIGAGASGRNSGAVQHPFDPALVELYEETLRIYELDRPPDGLLTVCPDPGPLERLTEDVKAAFPELEPRLLDPAELAQLEPALQPGLHGCRTETAWAVPPAGAVAALWARAQEAGALRAGFPESFELESDVILVTAGPWTPSVVDPTGEWLPIEPVWGTVAEVQLEQAPGHVLEEAGIPELAEALGSGEAAPELFSMVSAGGRNALGSTFSREQLPELETAEALVKRGERFLRGIGRVQSIRSCARPVSADGRPLIGRLRDDLWTCAGHGPWGISIGPASARLVADAILGREVEIRPELDAGRFGVPPALT